MKKFIPLLLLAFAWNVKAQDFPWHAAPVPNPFGLNSLVPFSFINLRDFDNDGTTEAFVMTGENRYYENTGDNGAPQFVLAETNPWGIPPFMGTINQPGGAFDFVDIDGDCDFDIFFATLNDNEGNPLLYLENTGTPEAPWFGDSQVQTNPFGFVQPVSDSVPGQHLGGFSWPTLVDIDADNDYDLFFSGRFLQPGAPVFDENFYFYRNDDPSGNGTSPQFTGPIKNPFNIAPPAVVPDAQIVSRFVDMDCDGDLDLFATYAGTLIAYFENTGTPAAPYFTDNPIIWWANNPPPPPGFDAYLFGDWIDIGNDGDMDHILSGGAGIFFLENITDGTMACQLSNPEYVQCLPPARVQFIHAADHETVRLAANGETLRETFAYQTATPFMDVPAGLPLDVEVIVKDQWSSNPDVQLPLNFEPGKTYVVLLKGTFDPSDPYPVSFSVFEGGREEGTNTDMVDMLFVRGGPDIPVPTDVVVEGGILVADNVMYGEFGADYVSLPATSFIVSPTPANDNSIFLDPVVANMGFWKGRTAVGFGTGLVTNGTFQPWVALSNGGTFPLYPPPPAPNPLIGSGGQNFASGLLITPNPANQLVQLHLQVLEEGRSTLEVVDVSGVKMLGMDFGVLAKGQHHFELSVGHLPAGIYFLKFRNASEWRIEPLVVVRP